jgi:hypothetical protein
MTGAQATEQIQELYFAFLGRQAHATLRRVDAQLKALPAPNLYPELQPRKVSLFKRESVASVLDVLHARHRDVPRAELHWFTRADTEDLAIEARMKARGESYHDFYSCLYDDRDLAGLYDSRAHAIWLLADLDGKRLVECAAHEFRHAVGRNETESEADAFGKQAAQALCPAGQSQLFFTEDRKHWARPGDSVLIPHGAKSWVRILRRDGSMEWHRPLEQYELFVAGQPTIQ